MTPTQGDTRCIALGHLTRMTVWNLRQDWNADRPTKEKLAAFTQAVSAFGDPDHIMDLLLAAPPKAAAGRPYQAVTPDHEVRDAVFF